jgi:hypothetical protein
MVPRMAKDQAAGNKFNAQIVQNTAPAEDLNPKVTDGGSIKENTSPLVQPSTQPKVKAQKPVEDEAGPKPVPLNGHSRPNDLSGSIWADKPAVTKKEIPWETMKENSDSNSPIGSNSSALKKTTPTSMEAKTLGRSDFIHTHARPKIGVPLNDPSDLPKQAGLGRLDWVKAPPQFILDEPSTLNRRLQKTGLLGTDNLKTTKLIGNQKPSLEPEKENISSTQKVQPTGPSQKFLNEQEYPDVEPTTLDMIDESIKFQQDLIDQNLIFIALYTEKYQSFLKKREDLERLIKEALENEVKYKVQLQNSQAKIDGYKLSLKGLKDQREQILKKKVGVFFFAHAFLL